MAKGVYPGALWVGYVAPLTPLNPQSSFDFTGVSNCGKPYTQRIILVGEDTNENFNQFKLPF